jgi:hypothetical protein
MSQDRVRGGDDNDDDVYDNNDLEYEYYHAIKYF